MDTSALELNIPITENRSKTGDPRFLTVYARGEGQLAQLTDIEAEDQGVSPWQLYECSRYEYHLPEGLSFNHEKNEADAIIQPSRIKGRMNEGQIRTGSYVGRIRRPVFNEAGLDVGMVEFEIRSGKLDYIAQYRQMLSDIAEKCDELLMLQSSPVLQTFDVDPSEDAQTLYERFTFLRAMLDNDELVSAVQRICASPMESLTTVSEDVLVSRSHRIGRTAMRQIVSSQDRVELDASDVLREEGIVSLPRRLALERRVLTYDTPENQFVKFALETFGRFLGDLIVHPNAGAVLRKESEGLVEKLEAMLSDPFFLDVGRLRRLPLQSPLLQRREGYRQVLRSWILFDCAAKFIWKGGDDVYDAGKRDVATLYEYWVFFQLYEAVCTVFNLDVKSSDQLVRIDRNKMAIQLRRGRILDLKASSECGRKLRVRFAYNRSFSLGELRTSGTWTTCMRPDYTLSIWPGDLDEKDAEAAEAIVHVHFDAKYRIERINEILGREGPALTQPVKDDDTVLNSKDCEAREKEKREEAELIYKQGDLLKMHAYNDAIRRTYGSYIIYPGDDRYPNLMREYHEVLPGLGAFALRPTKDGGLGVENIVKFIRDIRDTMINRMTQRERAAIHRGQIYNKLPESSAAVQVNLPDYVLGGFPPIPAEETVLIGYCRSEQLTWVVDNRLYNFRYERDVRGSIELTPEFMQAKYLLIHSKPENVFPPSLFELEPAREIMTDRGLKKLKYPSKKPSARLYFCVRIKKYIPLGSSGGVDFDMDKLSGFPLALAAHDKELLHLPFCTTLEDLCVHMREPGKKFVGRNMLTTSRLFDAEEA